MQRPSIFVYWPMSTTETFSPVTIQYATTSIRLHAFLTYKIIYCDQVSDLLQADASMWIRHTTWDVWLLITLSCIFIALVVSYSENLTMSTIYEVSKNIGKNMWTTF